MFNWSGQNICEGLIMVPPQNDMIKFDMIFRQTKAAAETVFDSSYVCFFIGHCLKLPDVTIATGCVLYHRFISATDNHNDFDLNVCLNNCFQ